MNGHHRRSLALRRGTSRVGVIVVIACIAILVTVLLPVLRHHRLNSISLDDRKHLVDIHQSWVIYAQAFNGRFPIPGLIDRLPADLNGDGIGDAEVEGIGPEDHSLNTTANLYSATIAQHYLSPAALISPLERNPVIEEDSDYNYNCYQPEADIFWDDNFVADLETGSNASYAHLPLVGAQRRTHWRLTSKAEVGVVSNRGPSDGIGRPGLYSCQPDGSWRGRIVFADGHVETIRRSVPRTGGQYARIGIASVVDNPFNYDPGLGGVDQVLAFTEEASQLEAVLQHD